VRLKAGQVRAKNVANQLTKNVLTWSVGVLVFFLVGAGVSSVVGDFTGGGGFTPAALTAVWGGGSGAWSHGCSARCLP
jgi:Amt family ammonium transporter